MAYWIGATHVNENEPTRTATRNIRFPNQMIEQINIALETKGQEFLSLGRGEACRRRLTSEKAYTSVKVMKNEHPAFFPPNRTIL